MRYILCLLCTCQLSISWSQFDQSLITARQIASGGQDLILQSPEALYSNPAALLLGNSSISGLVNYSNRYNTDIRSASAGISWKDERQGFGLLIGNYGIEGFRQNQVSAAYARKLSKQTRLGIQANYYNLQVEDFRSKTNLDLSIGLQHDFSESISTGLYLVNPFSEALVNQLNGGIGISMLGKITDALSIYSSVFRDWEGFVDLRPGIKYHLTDQIDILWSFNTEGSSMNFGTDVSITQDWSVFIAYNTHQFLGSSLSFSTMYIFQQ